MYIRRIFLATVCGAMLCGTPAPTAMAQHVHGVIELGVVLEDGAAAMSLRSPLANVVGFEHEPRDDAESARLRKAASGFLDAAGMFELSAEAQCSPKNITFEGPAFVRDLVDEQQGRHADHELANHESDHDSGHPEEDEPKLGHGDGHRGEEEHEPDHDDGHHREEEHGPDHDDGDHDENGHDSEHDGGHSGHNHESEHDSDHEHAGADVHGEISIEYLWECESPAELSNIRLVFLEWFESVESVQVQLITEAGFRLLELGGDIDVIDLDD